MKSLLLTNEYPPNVYGGAGVHVEFLARELARLIDVEVRCFGDQRIAADHLHVNGVEARVFPDATAARPLLSVLSTFMRGLDFAALDVDANVVHCHTWYSHLGGILVKLMYGVPLVVTAHSLEPLRPWKREQLGGGYDASAWVERTAIEMADAIIAVSSETRRDVLAHFNVAADRVHSIPNGIDPRIYRRDERTDALAAHGVDPHRPYVLFVGRITRQKGIVHLVRAIPEIREGVQVVLCAGQPDTPEIAVEMATEVARVSGGRRGVIWIQDMLPREQTIQLYSHAAVFCCPSIYEPFGLINLEAMACETPVVASKVGGIPEVVVPGETGLLVPIEQQAVPPFEPVDPAGFSAGLAASLNELLDDPSRRAAMGRAGRVRVESHFSWSAVAERTVALYRALS